MNDLIYRQDAINAIENTNAEITAEEWDGEKYTGSMTRREVTCVLKDIPEYGLMDGYCILSLQTPGWNYIQPSTCLDGKG